MRPQPMRSQLREPQCMGPQPIKSWPTDVFLFLFFFEAMIAFDRLQTLFGRPVCGHSAGRYR